MAIMFAATCKHGKKSCLLVSSNHELVAAAVEGTPKTLHPSIDIKIDAVINALTNCRYIPNGTAYLTYTPCLNSVQNLIAANIRNIIYVFTEQLDIKIDDLIKNAGVHVIKFSGNLNWMRDYVECINL